MIKHWMSIVTDYHTPCCTDDISLLILFSNKSTKRVPGQSYRNVHIELASISIIGNLVWDCLLFEGYWLVLMMFQCFTGVQKAKENE